ncbi:isopropanol dehydrogenase [Heterostelium album PN500]|uniref:Isopropanol dehydrogenase n=1 Tax=Heterostelium pallidum (strain ATCC 26659 / Pp 5 / PN500) TaxID=670386 RepID=D3B1U4_HETP5|nr:isopropanol dehydrogenase [Heterostelium album PN500]EFA85268.1 isopropanol dehydrogenase [Heterostelium album PN500]|eukprot:XP_020437377.1 isopropanol dehydrogenase [Heterostelium album PN500]
MESTPTTQKALVLHARDKPMSLEQVPIPRAKAGQAVVRVLAADIVPYMNEVLTGALPYPLSLPMTPGNTAIGRVHEVGPDSVLLKPGQLVLCDITIRGRDNPHVTILFGIHGGGYPEAQKLMDGEWRNATYAEYTTLPLENLYRLNEDVLTNQFKYSISDLCLLPVYLVPFGGLSDGEVKPGEVVIVAPATGRFGGGAVAVALAMGATVIAAGRNKSALELLEKIHGHTGRLKTVVVTGDEAANAKAFKEASPNPLGADVYIDFSPFASAGNTLLNSGVAALRPSGRAVIMGGVSGNITLPYLDIMFRSIRIQGRFMYDRKHIIQLIQMVESGLLKLGTHVGVTTTKEYKLETINEALSEASKLTGWGSHVVLLP